MPVAKTPFIRYKIINECLTNKRKPYPSLDEIKAALEKQDITVHTRQIERDFEAMRHDQRLGYHAPIAYSRDHRGYHYTDSDYTIDKLPLTSEEVEAFEIIVESFKRFKGAQVLNQVEGMFDKLDKVVMPQLKNKKFNADNPTVDFEKMPYSKGIEHFDVLYRAVMKKQPLLITYRKFDEERNTQHVFHPYLLKEYKFRWYVLGYSEKRHSKLILALDRMETVASAKVAFKPYKGTEIKTYFDHTIGVTIATKGVKEIRLWFSVSQGHYIKTQHLHATQHIVSDDATGVIATLQLIPNYELLQTLLSFGPEVEVLAPDSVRNDLKQLLEKNLARYKK